MIYGVEQSCHGHMYRWIFTKEGWEALSGNSHPLDENGTLWADIGCPIGGSNSSSTYVKELDSDAEISDFLLRVFSTDVDDPTLVEIAEGICTIDTNDSYYGEITSQYVEKLQIPQNKITVDNSLYQPTLKMIEEIRENDPNGESGIDYDNPFYGNSEDMPFSELKELHDRFCNPTQQEITPRRLS